MESIPRRQIPAVLWGKFSRKIGERGLFGILFLIYAAIPDYDGRNRWWLEAWAHSKPYFFSYSRYLLIAAGLALIWWDHRRLVRKFQPPGRNPESLEARTVQLRKQIVDYIATVPSPPLRSAGAKNYQDAIDWSIRLTSGFELRFRAQVNTLYLQFGELGLLPGIGWQIPEHINGTDKINEIVDNLEQLATIAFQKHL